MNDQHEMRDVDNQGRDVGRKFQDAETQRYEAEFDPTDAEAIGAFQEDALSEEDAVASADDLLVDGEMPVFLDESYVADDLPTHVTLPAPRKALDHREGETLAETLARMRGTST
jgi:hypothetical protein